MMKNGIDFVYEYSDLNLFQTRVQILTGEYAGIVLEFGSSVLAQSGAKNTFTFDYTLYEVPDQFYGPSLRTEPKFNTFLGYLLVDVIADRNNDPLAQQKLDEAASSSGLEAPKIKINQKFYPDWVVKSKEQPSTKGLQGF